MEGDKLAAFDTLYTVLTTLCGVCAPFIPFLTETMYQNLVVNNVPGAAESVHLTDYPVANEALINAELEAEMEEVITAVQLGRAVRNTANMKVRQPAKALYVKGAELSAPMAELIANELNVKAVRFVEDTRELTTYQLKPQIRTLGKKYGKLLGKIGQHLATMDGNEVGDAFNRGETVSFVIDETAIVLEKDDVLTSPMNKPGFVAESDREMMVVLDTNLTEELIEEGFVREVISKVQTMRKEADFDVVDRITIGYTTTEKLTAIIQKASETIANATLATEIVNGPVEGGYEKDWKINGENAGIVVKRG